MRWEDMREHIYRGCHVFAMETVKMLTTQAPCGFKHACDWHKSRSRCFWLWGIVAQKRECLFVLH